MTAAPTPTPHRGATHPGLSQLALVLAVAAALAVYLLVHFDVFGSSAPGGTVGSGHAIAETRAVGPFHAIELAGSNNVVIRVGHPRSVVVNADDNLVGMVTTVVRDGRLVIGNTDGSFTTRSPMTVTVTAPAVDAVTLGGAGNIDVDGIAARTLTVRLPGSGNLRVAGSAGTLNATITGSGNALLGGLAARDVRATVGGSGVITVTATNSLAARIPGSGDVFYRGNPPHLLTDVSGSGAVVPLP